jgi:hypothetical protein
VEFLGWQSQERCAGLMSKADVVALPSVPWGDHGSRSDGFRNASCGILIEPRDPARLVADLEQAIVSLANDRNRCASNGARGTDESSSRVQLADGRLSACRNLSASHEEAGSNLMMLSIPLADGPNTLGRNSHRVSISIASGPPHSA